MTTTTPSQPVSAKRTPHVSDRPTGATTFRFVRYTSNIAALRRIYVDALGMEVQWEAAPRPASDPRGPQHGMLMAGFPGAGWHIEWVEDHALAQPASSREGLDDLVFYLGQEPAPELLHQLTEAGATVIEGNPYWAACGVTFVDPDGHRTVLSTRTWAFESVATAQ